VRCLFASFATAFIVAAALSFTWIFAVVSACAR